MKKAAVPLIVVAAILLAVGGAATAQQPGRVPVIGRLAGTSPSADAARIEAFRQGLRQHGYVEGKNIVLELRFAEAKEDRLRELAAELVRRKVDVIVTGGPTSTRAAKEATSTIPIVMTNDTDPVASGIVASLARPGGNVTGLSNFSPELSGKRLEILGEVVPKLSRVAVLGGWINNSQPLMLREIEPAAKAIGVRLQYLAVQQFKDFESVFRAASKERAQAVLTFASTILNSQRAQLVELAAKNQLPAIYHQGRFVDEGGLMYYGVNLFDLDRRAATYVDKILKGRKPSDLPVEQPIKFEFIINLKAAKAIGLTIPPNVLVRADRVIR